jgi:1-deoxy-D-xylulose-5-phosphate synthase
METPLLDRIAHPSDLRSLEMDDLRRLAEEIRHVIVQIVARNGGHLASNLGVVELTLALHYVFHTPRDLIVWDVGHQCYPHKLLTGRKEQFHTLRQLGGISGFPRREESLFDTFGTGHSSTSISAALGMSEAMALKGEAARVVAVIGDGSMTAGMAFEALNHAGSLDRDLVVILNDNEMSISPNVGALSTYLSRILTGQLYTRVREEMKGFLKTLPAVGDHVSRLAKKWEEMAKGFLTPGILFEELGFKYVGPVDGHRLRPLVETLKNVRQLRGPILLHVITRKGKGYEPAEREPTRFHGVGPFDPLTGEIPTKKGPVTYTSVFGRTLMTLARKDERVVAITAAMPQGTGLESFAEAFPDRFYDVGIAEQHGVTFAAGLATQGLRPVVAIYSTFLQRAYDQILHDVCLQNLPVVFAMDRGGIVGEDGPTHHGLFDLSYLRPMPNMTLMAPKDERELQRMLATALEIEGPSALRYPRGKGVGVPLLSEEEISPLPVGRCEILREGDAILLIAVGSMVHPALAAAEDLSREGIQATVINARFIKPLDEERILPLVRRIPRVVTVEENVLAGGFGSAVLECLQERMGDLSELRMLRIGIPDVFVEHGRQDLLRRQLGLDSQGIARRILRWLEGEASQGLAALSLRHGGRWS